MDQIFDLRQNLPFLNGLYIAVSAVKDAYLVVDGPYCVFQKAEIHAAHDLKNTFVSNTGAGRIIHTDLHFNTNVAYNVTLDRGHDIEEVLKKVSKIDGAGVVFLTSMDFHQILSVPLERYRRSAAIEGRAPIILVETRSLEGDWLDGYSRLVCKLAENIAIGTGKTEKDKVAIVGHLMDRNEGDQTGNLREFERLLKGLGLEAVSVWLNGQGVDSLKEIGRASLVVSLPYARQAARLLSERLSIPLVEAELPLGLNRTNLFLRKIAEAAGKRDEAESFIAGSLKRVVPSVKDHIFRFLHDRKAVIQADPYMADGMLSLLDECGISSAKTMILGEKTGLPEAVLKRLEEKSAVFEPTISESGDIFPEKEDFDILMAPSLFPRFPRIASWIPFGYPNYFSHPVNPAPFLGYDGFIWWIERLTEAAQGRDTRAGGAAFRDFSGKD